MGSAQDIQSKLGRLEGAMGPGGQLLFRWGQTGTQGHPAC